jgi:hypothetical protein
MWPPSPKLEGLFTIVTDRFRSAPRLGPELVPELATECDFTVWHKSLA